MSNSHLTTVNRRIIRIRSKINSVKKGYKLVVFRSLRYISAQIVNLTTGSTLHAVTGKSPEEVGQTIAQKALKSKISQVIFDRGRYQYHGRVKAVADAARQTGLKL